MVDCMRHEALPRAGGQEGRLDDQPGVEGLALPYPPEMGLENAPRLRSRRDELVEAKRYGLAEVLE